MCRPKEPLRVPEVATPRFGDNRHMKAVQLSALSTGHLYPRRFSWYSFLLQAESTRAIMRPEGFRQ